jgi:hypothetical protein
MPLLLVPGPPGPRGRPAARRGARNGGQTAASAVPLPNLFLTRKPRLTRAGGAGPRRLEQLTTTLLNRETMSGSREQHS